MARFSDLPAELLLQILGYLQPAGADAFCMLSKRVRAAAGAFLKKHMEMRRAYTNCVHCSMPYFGRGDLKFAKLLRKVLQNSEIVPYVQRLHIKNWATDVDEYVDDFDDAEFTTPKDALEVLSQAIQKCDLIDGQGLKTEWINILRQHSEHATSALLLSLLPNIITLRLEDVGETYPDIFRQTSGTGALAQISVVELSEHHTMMGAYDRALAFFSLLPSMKQIFALNLDTRGSDAEARADSFETDSPPLDTIFADLSISSSPSRLTHMSFSNCRIHHSVWFALLRNMTNLISFKYCSNDRSRIREDEAEWFCKALLTFAKYSLRQLTLFTHDRLSMGSLRDFHALESLSTTVELLHRSSLGLSNFTNLLPCTLEQLRLRQYGRWDGVYHRNLVHKLLSLKDKEVPKLKSVQYLLDEGHVSSLCKKSVPNFDKKAGVDIRINWTQSGHTAEEIKEVLEGSSLVDASD